MKRIRLGKRLIILLSTLLFFYVASYVVVRLISEPHLPKILSVFPEIRLGNTKWDNEEFIAISEGISEEKFEESKADATWIWDMERVTRRVQRREMVLFRLYRPLVFVDEHLFGSEIFDPFADDSAE